MDSEVKTFYLPPPKGGFLLLQPGLGMIRLGFPGEKNATNKRKKLNKKVVQCKILGDIDSTVQKWNLDHNENASCRMYITHEGDPICIVQKNGYKTQVQILVNH